MKKLATAVLGMTLVSCAHERSWSDRANPVPGPKAEVAKGTVLTPPQESNAENVGNSPSTTGGKHCLNQDGTPCAETIVVGGLDKSIIDEYIRRHLPQLRACYDRELLSKPGLRGRVATKFVIHGSGKVESASVTESTLGSPVVEKCILKVMKGIEFPEPLGGGRVEVDYPFSFAPAANSAANTPLGPIACAEPYINLHNRLGKHDGMNECGQRNPKTGKVEPSDVTAVRWGRTWVFFRDNAAYGYVDHGRYETCNDMWIENICK